MHLFTLDDPRPIAAAAPYTYFLPQAERLAAIQSGDSVKLIFRPTASGTKWDAERMWVQVRAVDGERLSGVLDNDPDDIPGLEVGAVVSFCSWHVIAIQFADDRAEPPPYDNSREYWERCMVDSGVLDGSLQVDYLYREEPALSEPDEYPDSGWRIRGDMRASTDEEVDGRDPAYVPVGAVLNKDDSWLHLIDEPIGSAFRRDFASGTYVRVDPNYTA